MENESEPEIQIEYYEIHETDHQLSDVLRNVTSSSNPSINDNISNEDDENKTYLNLSNPEIEELDNMVVDTEISWHQSTDSNGRLSCKYCNLKYSTKETLRIHIKRKHTNEYKTFKKIVLNHKRNSKHICRICKNNFTNIIDLKNHVKNNHTINAIKLSCTNCDATFSTNKELYSHMYIKHNKNLNLLTFICEICGYRTVKKSHYLQHYNTHIKKGLSCTYCDYKTNSKSNLTIHEYIHTNNKPYACDFEDCFYRCSSKSALRGHKLRHYPEKNMLFCDKCNYKTVYKHSLKKHSNSHERNCTRVK